MDEQSQQQTITQAFTTQAESFSASRVANADRILDAISFAAAAKPTERWLEAACGPGIVSRHLAPRVASVHGVDVTARMLEIARRETAAAGLANVSFALADATATGLPDAGFDGAVTRFSLHHVPLPGRLVAEMTRLVRPGGRIVAADHLADDQAEARARVQEIERLRDPSHWASLTAVELRALGAHSGLELLSEHTVAYTFDFDDWLARGTTDSHARTLVESALAAQPQGTPAFGVTRHAGARALTLQIWVGAWQRP